MSAPSELAALQRKNALRFAVNCTGFGMGVVHVVDQTFVIGFLSPGIVGFRLALPVHRSFLIRFVALKRPLTGPGIADACDVFAFLGRLRQLECWSRGALRGHDWQCQARAVASEL